MKKLKITGSHNTQVGGDLSNVIQIKGKKAAKVFAKTFAKALANPQKKSSQKKVTYLFSVSDKKNGARLRNSALFNDFKKIALEMFSKNIFKKRGLYMDSYTV